MNKQETAKILAVIKQTYPAFYYRQSEDDIKKSVNLWQSLFEDDDAVIVGAALKSFIVSDASGYPPTPRTDQRENATYYASGPLVRS